MTLSRQDFKKNFYEKNVKKKDIKIHIWSTQMLK